MEARNTPTDEQTGRKVCTAFIVTGQDWPAPWSRALLEKLIVTQLIKKLLALYETRGLRTVFTKRQNWPHLETVHPVQIFIAIFFSIHLNIILPSFFLYPGLLPNILYAFIISLTCTTRPAHLMLLNLIILITFGEVKGKLKINMSLCHEGVLGVEV
jgi:hypothetical protein